MPTITIAGLGLIGGSVGMALRQQGWRVLFNDPHVTLDEARAHGAADDLASTLSDGDVTLVATPVDVALQILPSLTGPSTSVCSVMWPLREAARGPFVAGHPMAGSQERGLSAARTDLFTGKKWFVDRRDPLVDAIVAACGATLVEVDAKEHDRAVAATSHLPQILSTALASYLSDQGLEQFAGSGLQTFLRLAASDARVWGPVLDANREPIRQHLEEFSQVVQKIVNENPAESFKRAQAFIQKLK